MKLTRKRRTDVGSLAGFRRLHRRQDGQAMFVVVVFFLLLAGLVFLVMNSGEKLNHKVEMQSAADSVTTSGAGWYARGLNTISFCNVTDTQLLSLIVLLDTMETVVPPATECIDDLVKNIGASKAGHDIPIDERLADPDATIDKNMFLVVGNAASEQEVIRRFADIVKAVNWPDYLNYDSGVLWECTKLLDGFSHAMIRETPLAAQREAMDIAKKNHAAFGFLVPLWPELPVVDGTFRQFINPMWFGRMPPEVDPGQPPDVNRLLQDYPRRPGTPLIGGFAWVMNYRGYRGNTMGPWWFWREPFTTSRPMGLFDISRFSVLFRIVSAYKFAMLFGGTDDKVSLREWEMDYDKAKQVPQNEIRRCWWESESFDARYPQANDLARPWQPEDPGQVKPPYPPPPSGDWPIKKYDPKPIPTTRIYYDMTVPNLSQYTRAKESWDGADPRQAVWYRVQQRRTAQYPEIGIIAPHPPVHPDGSPWSYLDSEKKTYYHVTLWRFNGLEKEGSERLHRRYLPPEGETPNIAPILFDPTEGDNTTDNIQNHFTFNGFAYRSGKIQNWATRFVNPNPNDALVCYAQARVYCRYSWDLFTQYWKVKLMRTDRWSELVDELGKGVPPDGQALAAELTPEHIEPVRKMLTSYTDDFVKEVSH